MSTRRPTVLFGLALACLCAALRTDAQQSPSYRVESAVINNGGHPEQGAVLAGSTYRISLDAIGDSPAAVGLASGSFHLGGGFVDAYAPPGEVMNHRFTSASTMTWDAEKSVGVYEVYRGALGALPGGYGSCFQSSLSSTTASDGGTPPLGQGWFYLVTAKNRLGEEGTKGYDSNSIMRPNLSPCP